MKKSATEGFASDKRCNMDNAGSVRIPRTKKLEEI
jgi:hypothetical protein